ncbi:MAG: T9SS type A sorting domain-containing protein, partial [Bacteroidia bacterium]|nr:T9SS type A sorting domain-containing protein [Bacteroidia bacterium]
TDANGCSSTSNVDTVTVNALPTPPVITASGSTTFCDGNSVTLSSSYSTNNLWSNGDTNNSIVINAVGTHVVDVTYTDANGCSSTSNVDTVTVNPLPTPPVITAYGSLVFCQGDSVLLASNKPNDIVWSNGSTDQSIFVNTTGLYTVAYTDTNGCSNTSDAVYIEVNTTTFTSALNLPLSSVCEGSSPIVLTGGTPSGGSYSGVGVVSNIFYPALVPDGTYNIDYSVMDANGCLSTASQNIIVLSSTPVSATASQTIVCSNDNLVTLTGTPTGGIFSGNGVTANTFDPATAGPGIHTISYQYTNANSCTTFTDFNIIVNAPAQLVILPIADLCENTGSYPLNYGYPVGGDYLIDGVAATEINTDILNAGTHTLTYTYTPASSCGNTVSIPFVIHASPIVNFAPISAMCPDAAPLVLSGGTPLGGNYYGQAVLAGVFYPALANANNLVNYTYTDINGCSATASQNINVITPQAVSFPVLTPICYNQDSLILNMANPSGGIYSGNGVNNNIFYPQIAGTGNHSITYEIVDINGCSSSAVQTILVNNIPNISTTSVSSICENDSTVALNFAQPTGGIYQGTGVSFGSFDPSISGNGTFSITYTFTDNNGCSNTADEDITVNSIPTVSHTDYNNVCAGSGLIALNNGLPAGGTYSGLFVNNGMFDSSVSGTFAVDYNYTDNNGCSATATANITVNAQPTISISALGNICAGSGNIILSNATPLGGIYSGAGISNGVLNPSSLSSGIHTLYYSYTDSIGCIGTDSLNYNVYDLQVNAGSDQSISCTTSATLQGQSNYSGNGTLTYSWSPATGLSSTNTAITTAQPASSTNYVLTVTDGVCSANDTVLVFVNQPNFNLSATSNTQILNSAPFIVFFTNNTPSPSSYSFVWDFGDGTTYNGFQPLYHNYNSNGTFTVTLIATAIGSGCTDTLVMHNLITCNNGVFCNDSANIIVDGNIIPNNSNYSTTVCANSNFTLNCNTYPNYSYQWYYNGLPIQGAYNSSYVPNITGYYTIGITNNNCISLSSPVYITVLPAPPIPNITSTGSNNFCGGGTMQLTADSGYDSYLWSTGETTPSISVNTSGNYWVRGFDTNGCYSQSTDYSINGSNMLPQYICLTSVDTVLNKNKILWEKPITTSIDSFIVYREGSLAGSFDEIGRVAYEDVSEYIDYNSAPDVSNNRYRLAILDSCGNLTTQGDIHATIKTWIVPLDNNGDSLDIYFTKYVGIDNLTYTLYRGETPDSLYPIGNPYTFNPALNIYSIKDMSPPSYPSGYVYYQVRANIPYTCSSDSNSYHQSISNTVGFGNALGLDEQISIFDVNVYPNPNNGLFVIAIETGSTENIQLGVYNSIGELIWEKELESVHGKQQIQVPIAHVSQGIYHLRARTNNKVINKKLIINK